MTDTNDPFTKKRDPGYPINYKVPDYGMDHDVKTTQNNIKNAEETLGHELKMPEKKVPGEAKVQLQSDPICIGPEAENCEKPTMTAGYFSRDGNWKKNYPVANFGVDHDILST